MNTIRSTFNRYLPAYTVVGGGKRLASNGICAVLLGRGGRYTRNSSFKELQSSGFDYVLSMETAGERYDIEELSGLFPFVRFIMLKNTPNTGQQINIAAAEADTPLFFVLWNDFHAVLSLDAGRIAERLMLKTPETGKTGETRRLFSRLCTAPVIQNPQFETLPNAYAPVINGKKFETAPFAPVKEGAPTLYPFDAAGIYDRERFIDLGGFDPVMDSRYWQLLDFGLRAWLWGEEIRCTQQVRFRLDGATASEDGTAEESYMRFFLKNLAPVIQTEKPPAKDHGDVEAASAHLPLRQFPPYLLNSACPPLRAFRNFMEIRRWVKASGRRFVNDITGITSFWETPAKPNC